MLLLDSGVLRAIRLKPANSARHVVWLDALRPTLNSSMAAARVFHPFWPGLPWRQRNRGSVLFTINSLGSYISGAFLPR